MTKTLHKHHIVPKHMGGSDDSSNLVELTIEEHAEAHRVLYEKYGRWQDELAWKGLAGMLSTEECIQRSLSEAGKKGGATHKGKKGHGIEGARATWEKNKEKITSTLRENAQRAKGKKGKEFGGARRKWIWVNDGNSNMKVLADEGVPNRYVRGRLM